MTRQEFICEFTDVVGADPGSLGPDTVLTSLEGWDSVAYLSTVVLMDDQLGVSVRPEALQEAVTVNDILALVASRLAA
jgi:acyl carrier protein